MDKGPKKSLCRPGPQQAILEKTTFFQRKQKEIERDDNKRRNFLAKKKDYSAQRLVACVIPRKNRGREKKLGAGARLARGTTVKHGRGGPLRRLGPPITIRKGS